MSCGTRKQYSKRHKIMSAIQTCYERIESGPNLRSVDSLGNIGAKYPGYIKSLEPLIKLLNDEYLHSKIPSAKGIPKYRNSEYYAHCISSIIKTRSIVSIRKICNANPWLINESLLNTLISELIQYRECHTKSINCRYGCDYSYMNELIKTLGVLGRRNENCAHKLINLFNSKEFELIKPDIGMAVCYTERPKYALKILSELLTLYEPYKTSRLLTKTGRHAPNKMLGELLVLLEKYHPEKNAKEISAIIITIAKLAVLERERISKCVKKIMIYRNHKRIKFAVNYAVSIIAPINIELVREYIHNTPYLLEYCNYAKRVARGDINILFNAKLKGQKVDFSNVIKTYPDKYLLFLSQHREIVDSSIIDALEKARDALSYEQQTELVERYILRFLNDKRWRGHVYHSLEKIAVMYPEIILKYLDRLVAPLLTIPEKYENILTTVDRKINSQYLIYAIYKAARPGCGKCEAFAIKLSQIMGEEYSFKELIGIMLKTGSFTEHKEILEPIINSIADKCSQSHYGCHGENCMDAFILLLKKHPEFVLKHLDFVILLSKKGDKYTIKRTIEILGEVYQKYIQRYLFLEIIVKHLGHPHYRVFNASKKVLLKIINAENADKIVEFARKTEDPVVIRRAKKAIIKKLGNFTQQ